MKTALLFPGQGSQVTGMGRKLAARFPAAAAVFEGADRALGFSLSRLIWEGPEEELQKTENTQPALLVTSIAYLRVLEWLGVKADFVAGHSLGEYSALVAAGALDFEVACRLVKARGRYMQEAVPAGEGAMAALLGLEAEGAEGMIRDLCQKQPGVLGIAGLNAPGQTVISGSQALVNLACERAREFGCRKATLLKVSAPFHCALMKPAEDAMRREFETVKISPLHHPYIANVHAKVVENPGEVISLLLDQICLPVRWRETVETLYRAGVRRFIEVGAGEVLTGLTKRSLPKEALSEVLLEAADHEGDLASLQGISFS